MVDGSNAPLLIFHELIHVTNRTPSARCTGINLETCIGGALESGDIKYLTNGRYVGILVFRGRVLGFEARQHFPKSLFVYDDLMNRHEQIFYGPRDGSRHPTCFD